MMNEKIVEKFKDTEFLKKIIVLPDEEKVKEEFKKEGIEVEDKDLKEIKDLIKCSVEIASNLSSEELEKISAGLRDGVVRDLSDKMTDWLFDKIPWEIDQHGTRTGLSPSITKKEKFYYKIYNNSDKIVEAGLATMLVGMSVGGTLGLQKLIKTGKEKGWWTKDYWIKKK